MRQDKRGYDYEPRPTQLKMIKQNTVVAKTFIWAFINLLKEWARARKVIRIWQILAQKCSDFLCCHALTIFNLYRIVFPVKGNLGLGPRRSSLSDLDSLTVTPVSSFDSFFRNGDTGK